MAEAIIRQPEITSRPIGMVPIVRQSTATNASDKTLNMKPIRDTVTKINRPTTDITVASNDHILTSNDHLTSSNGQYVGPTLNNYHGTPVSHTITQNGQTVTTVSHPVTLVPWSEFITNPSMMHGLFDDTPGSLNYDQGKVTVLLGPEDDEVAKSARTLHVKTVEDLIRVRDDMTSKPILWQTKLTYRQRVLFCGHYSCAWLVCSCHLLCCCVWACIDSFFHGKTTINNKTIFAVLLDTKHPVIADRLNAKFEEAREHILRGERFCLEISLTECLDAWYEKMVSTETVDSYDECCDWYFNLMSSESLGTRLYITNSSPYEHGFDCDDCWASAGFCCWLFSAPCYIGFRRLHTEDVICNLDVDTPILHRTTTERQQTPLELMASINTDNTPIVDPFAAPVFDYGPKYHGPIHFAEDM